MDFPRFVRVRQQFGSPGFVDVEKEVGRRLVDANLSIRKGASIAIAVGSRGIANLKCIVRTVVAFVRSAGAKPFIIPAMGSHGGATPEGQAELLASYGVIEANVGCPIRSSLEVVDLPRDGLPNALFMDRQAWESDGVLVINRIKPHTDFHGSYESGLAKMLVIGLGKERQAYEMHRFGVHGLRDLIPPSARKVVATGKVLGGLAIIEDANERTAIVEALRTEVLLDREPALLEIARANMPRLPVDDLDLLIVDRMGKNISGAGVDTNIIGRIRIYGEPEPVAPRIKSIAVCDLTDESHGNAAGVGLVDVVTRRLFQRIDFPVTYRNIITSGTLERGKLPVVAESARHACEIGLRAAGCLDPAKARVIRMQDTLHLADLLVSETLVPELRGASNVELIDDSQAMFDPEGELLPCWSAG